MTGEEPEIKWTPETLVRLDAVGTAPLCGTDAATGAPALTAGFGRCTAKPRIVHGDYLGRTTCETKGRRAALEFPVAIDGPSQLILRARHLSADNGVDAELTIRAGGRTVGVVSLRSTQEEHRVELPAGSWPAGIARVELQLAGAERFELDHLLVLAHP